MRRRQSQVDPATAPPARLRAYDPADWMPLVDTSEYHPDNYRNVRDHVPYGEPWFSFENWWAQEAFDLWSRARLDWCDEFGWPGGLDFVDLLQETVQVRRKSNPAIDPFRLHHG